MLRGRLVHRGIALVGILAVLALSVGANTGALALPGDAGSGTYGPAAGTNTYNARITNTGTTNHFYDYVQVPGGNSVTGCTMVSGFPAGSTCVVNGGGPGTAEVNIASPGLAPNASGVFSFTTSNALCNPNCPDLSGKINSTSDPANYVPISFTPVVCKPITLGGGDFPDGIQGNRYGRVKSISGGQPPYTAAVTSGSIPQGMEVAVTSTGHIDLILRGTPTESGTFTFTVTVTDSTITPPGPCSGSQQYTVVIHCGGITITGKVSQNAIGDVGDPLFGASLKATGGTPPYTWSVEGIGITGLPPGTHLSPSKATDTVNVVGTPTEEGWFVFYLLVTDANGCEGSVVISISIDPRLQLKTATTSGGVEILVTTTGKSGREAGYAAARATSGASKTPVPNDLRYRRKPIGGHFGSYKTVFSNKSSTSVKVAVTRGYVYCFSAEPHAAAGKGWGRAVCKTIKKAT